MAMPKTFLRNFHVVFGEMIIAKEKQNHAHVIFPEGFSAKFRLGGWLNGLGKFKTSQSRLGPPAAEQISATNLTTPSVGQSLFYNVAGFNPRRQSLRLNVNELTLQSQRF